jgi:hypothetical protein
MLRFLPFAAFPLLTPAACLVRKSLSLSSVSSLNGYRLNQYHRILLQYSKTLPAQDCAYFQHVMAMLARTMNVTLARCTKSSTQNYAR